MDGTIERLQRIAAAREGVIGLAGGLPADELLPRDAFARAFERAVHGTTSAALQYGWPEGSPALRRWIADRMRARGADVDADDVIVTSGAQQALAIAGEIVLSPGARVGVDAESYPGALDLFRTCGARPIASDRDVAAIYAMTGVSNPRGRALSSARRRALLDAKVPLLVDEAYADLRFDGATERAFLGDAPDRTWSIGTFSKSLCPGLRVGWLVPPRRDHARALRVKRDLDLQAGSLAQSVIEQYLARESLDDHLAKARVIYAERADRLVRALRGAIPEWRFDAPEGGFAIWIETDEPGDDRRFLAHALRAGVSFDPGRLFRADESSSPLALRVCYSAQTPEKLEEGARRLARAWRSFRAERRSTPIVERASAFSFA